MYLAARLAPSIARPRARDELNRVAPTPGWLWGTGFSE